VKGPDLASLRAVYRRRPTLFDQQELARKALHFEPMSEAQRRAVVRALRQELGRTADRERLLVFVRHYQALQFALNRLPRPVGESNVA
jgi:hypothetical protein